MIFGASTRMAGMTMAFPDTCKVPTPAGPVPTPFPNIAQLTMAIPPTCSMKVLILNQPVIHQQSEIPMSSGDEAGVAGGVVSGMNMGPAKPKVGSSKVQAEGMKIVYQTCMFGQNGSNANMPAGVQAAPSQTLVTVMP